MPGLPGPLPAALPLLAPAVAAVCLRRQPRPASAIIWASLRCRPRPSLLKMPDDGSSGSGGSSSSVGDSLPMSSRPWSSICSKEGTSAGTMAVSRELTCWPGSARSQRAGPLRRRSEQVHDAPPIARFQTDAAHGRMQDAIARVGGQFGHFGVGRGGIDAGLDGQINDVRVGVPPLGGICGVDAFRLKAGLQRPHTAGCDAWSAARALRAKRPARPAATNRGPSAESDRARHRPAARPRPASRRARSAAPRRESARRPPAAAAFHHNAFAREA